MHICSKTVFARHGWVLAHRSSQGLRLHAQDWNSQKPSLDGRKNHEVPDLAEELLASMAVGERESIFLRGVTSMGLPVFLEIVLLPWAYRQFVNEFRKNVKSGKQGHEWVRERLKGRECKVDFSKALDW